MNTNQALRRYLEQRRELGESDLVLDQMSVEEAMRTIGALGASGRTRGAPVAAAVARAERPRSERPRSDGAHSGTVRRPSTPPASMSTPASSSTPAAPPTGSGSGLVVGSENENLFVSNPFSNLTTVEQIADSVAHCTRCKLYKTATLPVPGEGNPNADLVCVGEAPGANEDATGRPFVGRAGELLTKILAAIDIKREDVFICNVLKHRPPGNRNPSPDEVQACSPYLIRQIELVRPKVVVAFGTFAAQTLLDTKMPIGKLRGTVHRYHGVPLIVTYHPAALLRNPAWKRPAWEDVKLARRVLDGATS